MGTTVKSVVSGVRARFCVSVGFIVQLKGNKFIMPGTQDEVVAETPKTTTETPEPIVAKTVEDVKAKTAEAEKEIDAKEECNTHQNTNSEHAEKSEEKAEESSEKTAEKRSAEEDKTEEEE